MPGYTERPTYRERSLTLRLPGDHTVFVPQYVSSLRCLEIGLNIEDIRGKQSIENSQNSLRKPYLHSTFPNWPFILLPA